MTRHVGGHMTGQSLHSGLRRAPVQISASDLEQLRCIACGKPISDDRHFAKIAQTCSNVCSNHVALMRRLGKPIEWAGPFAPGRHSGNKGKKPSRASNEKRRQAMLAYHRKKAASA